MRHMGIVLRARSAYKRTLTILDERLGKIEGLGAYKQNLIAVDLLALFIKPGVIDDAMERSKRTRS